MAKELAERLRAFNEEVMAFVDGCSDADWGKLCATEDWSVGVVARHLGTAHYGAIDMAGMVLKGEKLPELTMAQIVDMANEHAREHADCTKAEVLGILREKGEAMVAFVSGLQDADLDRKGHLVLMGGEVSVQKLIETIVLRSGGEHLASMRAAAAA